MQKRRLFLVAGIPAILVLAALAWWVAARPSPTDGLTTAQVTVGDIEQTVLATGKLRPKELVSVGAQVSGQVKKLYVQLGQRVKAGDPIADIDAAPQRLALRNAEAAVGSLVAQKGSRQGALVQAELAWRRQKTMLTADATSRADYEAAEAALTALRGELRSLDAQIVQARTQVETARLNLGFTRILAPMDGTIVAIVTKQGQTVNSFQSAPTIVMLARLDVMTVRTEISEADVQKVRAGQVVRFTTLGAPDQRYHAQIDRIEPAPESMASESTAGAASASGASAGTAAIYYNALFDVPNPEGRLRPSMTAQVSVLLASAHRSVLVPLAALGERGADGRYQVRVVDRHGQIETRLVRIGIANDTNAVAISGLSPREKVVIAQETDQPISDGGMGMGF
ncbi:MULTISPECIES: efflux RND transporter periplasmic adaptor subunit [unclassified Sphingobium]|uniref:efflux RND transporter periplasmic adaptor subunit n=1 Tax=unclassified Sphingobium TaxID=2611147 RepID=UPI00222424B6|nr:MULTISPECIES: efflux RND transporter periplasmic adaptor subunit [unclassified Sphingobium]MCW2395757.1 macrolide-specific efflux system membrane fusion protein [Sphingobium sp. B8D3B]MCW2419272.1 macrolide-specific efflux system membrane fusion protein [Sphingobium sp. B8D3C]